MSSEDNRKRPSEEHAEEENSSKRCRTIDDVVAGESISGSHSASFAFLGDAVQQIDGKNWYDRVILPAANAHESLVLHKGDVVALVTESEENTSAASGSDAATTPIMIRVDGFYCNPAENDIKKSRDPMVTGRLLLVKEDLKDQLSASEDLLKQLRAKDVVLTNLRQEAEFAAIDYICSIHYIRENGPIPPDLPQRHFLCRFKLDIDAEEKTMELAKYESEEESQGLGAIPMPENNTHADTAEDTISSGSAPSDDESTSSVEQSRVIIQEGEGTSLRANIQVGSRYQMRVGPFVPVQAVKSRGAKLVYEKGRISDQNLETFLNKVADMHNEYLDKLGIVMEEPYSPLPSEQAEIIMKKTGQFLTGSYTCTAGMLCSSKCRLRKECDVDAILEILAECDYDAEQALIAIKDDLNRITSGWTRYERDIFDDGFRRHQGALRIVARAIKPTKTMKDIVDYHYRFKIPDQFRKYQDKKREQAVRIVECIQTRKHHESITNYHHPAISSNGTAPVNEVGGRGTHWSDKSVFSVSEAKDERFRAAKQLLLDVKDAFGRDVMAEVASVIRQLNSNFDENTRDDLFSLLDGQPEMQKKFLQFMPKHFS
jgi:hypothetical protein